MVLSELLKAIQPIQIIGSTETEITGVNIDSRLVQAGHLFMAMRGTQTDGHVYIPAAIEKGAVAVLCEDVPEAKQEGITYIQVKDSEDAVGKVATTFYDDPTSKMELVGVTGKSLFHRHILEQLIDNIPEGPYQEKMKPIIRVPEGQYYTAVEGSRGEFGIFLESHGDKTPYRLHFRSTGLPLVSTVDTICRGAKIADLIAIGGTLDYVVPDIDR